MTPVRAQDPDASDKHGRLEWKVYAACAQWLRSGRQIAAYHPDRSWKLLAEAEFGGTWPVTLCWSISKDARPVRMICVRKLLQSGNETALKLETLGAPIAPSTSNGPGITRHSAVS
jgi:hypothetical protein